MDILKLENYPPRSFPLPDNHGIPPVPGWLHVFLFLGPPIALAFNSHRSLLLALIAVEIYWLRMLPFYQAGDYVNTYLIGATLFSCLAKTLISFFLRDPNRDYIKILSRQPNGKPAVIAKLTGEVRDLVDEKDLPPLPLWRRYLLAFDCWQAPRGVGWSFQVKNVREGKPVGYSRWKFVGERIIQLLRSLLIIDLSHTYTRLFSPLIVPSRPKSSYEHPVLETCLYALLAWFSARHFLSSGYYFAAIVSVITGLSKPYEWPPLFGKWSDSYTVRRHWSYTWHQMTRTVTERPAQFLIHDVLGIRKGTYLSNYGKLFVVFFISGALHSFGAHVAVRSDLDNLGFFVKQAAAIWVEETVIALAGFAGIKEEKLHWRLIGYVWTASWMAFSLRTWLSGNAMQGGNMQSLIPFSVAEPLVKAFLPREILARAAL